MGDSDRGLNGDLGDRPERYEFSQLVRHLRRLAEADAAARGEPQGARDLLDIVKFRSHVSLSFPASDVQEVLFPGTEHANGEATRLGKPIVTVNFMGLANPTGPLPLHFVQFVIERLRKRDTASRDFFDIFNDIFIRKFALAREKPRPHLSWERADRGEGIEAYGSALLGNAANAETGVTEDIAVHAALSGYAGLLGRRPGSAASIEQVLRLLLRQSVQVLPFRARWLPISRDSQARLGTTRLGDPMALGIQSLDHQSSFVVRIGPVTLTVFDSLLPGRRMYRRIVQVVRFGVGIGLDFILELRLQQGQVPAAEIRSGAGATGQLGMNTWLVGNPPFNSGASVQLHVSGAGV